MAPKWLLPAIERMRRERKLGVVFRVPNQRSPRRTLGYRLVELLDSDDPDVHEVFSECVAICAGDEVIRYAILDARKDECLFGIDGGLSRVDGCAEIPSDDGDLVAAMRALIHGRDRTRLAESAAAIRYRLEGALNPESAEALSSWTPDVIPLIVERRIAAKTPEDAEGWRSLIEWYYACASSFEPGPRLPYGLAVHRPFCGAMDDDAPENERGGAMCGMAECEPNARSFLRFLAVE